MRTRKGILNASNGEKTKKLKTGRVEGYKGAPGERGSGVGAPRAYQLDSYIVVHHSSQRDHFGCKAREIKSLRDEKRVHMGAIGSLLANYYYFP